MTAFREVIKGTLFYPWLATPNPRWNKYQVTVGGLSEETARALLNAGAKVKKDDKFNGYYVILNNKEPIVTVDAGGNGVSDKIAKSVGNGTVANINAAIVPSKFNNAGQYCEGVQIIKLVEYSKGSAFEPQEGYKVGDAPAEVITAPEASDEDDIFDN